LAGLDCPEDGHISNAQEISKFSDFDIFDGPAVWICKKYIKFVHEINSIVSLSPTSISINNGSEAQRITNGIIMIKKNHENTNTINENVNEVRKRA